MSIIDQPDDTDWRAKHDQVVLDAAKTCEQALQAQLKAEALAARYKATLDSLHIGANAPDESKP